MISDYFEEYAKNLRTWAEELAILRHEERSEEVVSAVQGLVKLYTNHVFPDKVMKILNNGLRLQHVLPAGVEPTGELRVSLLLDLSMELHKFLLHVDDPLLDF